MIQSIKPRILRSCFGALALSSGLNLHCHKMAATVPGITPTESKQQPEVKDFLINDLSLIKGDFPREAHQNSFHRSLPRTGFQDPLEHSPSKKHRIADSKTMICSPKLKMLPSEQNGNFDRKNRSINIGWAAHTPTVSVYLNQ